MSHFLITVAIIVVFVLISLVMNRLTLRILGLKPTWNQVFTITGTIFTVQLLLALPALINPKIAIGPLLSLVSIAASIVIWCMLLRKLFQLKLAKSLLGVVLFYALTAAVIGAILLIVHLLGRN